MPEQSAAGVEETSEIEALIATLYRTGKRLEEITAGKIDTVADARGNVLMLPGAQSRLHHLAVTLQEKLRFNASYDLLTGLANRSLFITRVEQHLGIAAAGGRRLAVLLIDLERFKSVNDSLGQPAGDALLIQVAESLTRIAGDAGLLARTGPDLFALVLPEVGLERGPAGLLEKTIRACLAHMYLLNEDEVQINAKVGIAVFPDDGSGADALLKRAEAALKKAKATGKRHLFYKRQMTEGVTTRLTLENQLRQAFDNEEFVLHFQPKISLKNRKLTGAEALIRWNDPRTGMVPPARFIPVLEETGMIYQVGGWALRKAVETGRRWRAAGLPAVPIAVNVSPLQLRNPRFVSELRQIVGGDAQAAGLELEITESVVMENVGDSIESLRAIRAMGIAIAIDDFGTGFSSLAYLARLSIDILKIDRAFVTDMTAGPQEFALVNAIITLAHALRLKVVAEGVETEEQSSLLRSLGCDEMQGFLFSKPVPEEIFETMFLACADRPAVV